MKNYDYTSKLAKRYPTKRNLLIFQSGSTGMILF